MTGRGGRTGGSGSETGGAVGVAGAATRLGMVPGDPFDGGRRTVSGLQRYYIRRGIAGHCWEYAIPDPTDRVLVLTWARTGAGGHRSGSDRRMGALGYTIDFAEQLYYDSFNQVFADYRL